MICKKMTSNIMASKMWIEDKHVRIYSKEIEEKMKNIFMKSS